jgi:predicted ATPase/DNA-binding CsgD family transcriptional regulator
MTLGLIWRRPGELPLEVTGFVGRQRELAALTALLRTARLVTVTGPGGVGKTRVALRAAVRAEGQFADGVCLAELGGLRDPALLPLTVATCLGLPEPDARSGAQAIIDYLRDRELLLILDTCEHLIGACADLIGTVLRHAPGVTVLATSRQPLDLPGEHPYPIPPLPVPGSDAAPASRGDAVELFAQRAAAADPGFAVTTANRADVIRLCRRLDGIPLAIELATVQLRAVPLHQLAGRLERRFLQLTGGRRVTLPHHQTLRATTQWSFDLCSPAEQLLWTRLSVFAGTFDIPAAEAVCAGGELAREDVLPALIGLVDKSVVLRAEEDGGGYRLLDTIAEFGAELLAASGDQAGRQDRHISYFRALAADFSHQAKGDDQLARYRQLRREHANIRAALGYCLARPDHAPEAAQMAADLRAYWEISGLLREGRYWLGKILVLFAAPSAQRSWLLMTRGTLATLQGELAEAVADLQACIPMAAEHGEDLACALGYSYLCLAFAFCGRHPEAAAAGTQAAERLGALDYFPGLVSLDIHLGYLHLLGGELSQAIDRCAQGLARLGDSQERWARGYLQIITALALFLQGADDASAAAARTSLTMKHELGDTVGMAYCLEELGMLAARQQRCERTAWLLGAAGALWERAGTRLGGNAILEEFHAQAAKVARDTLGADRYDARFRGGAGCPLDAVIALALADADDLAAPAGGPGQQPGHRSPGLLTSRERQIAALVAQGLSNRDIAQQLGISKRTVDAHIDHIFGKLGLTSRVQLVTWLSDGSGAGNSGAGNGGDLHPGPPA